MVDSKQDMLGAINNAVVDEFVAKGILLPPQQNGHDNTSSNIDPGGAENGNIAKRLLEYTQAIANANYFGDEGSKGRIQPTLNDLESTINNRRKEMERETGKIFSPVTQEEIAVAVKTGWDKAILERQQATQKTVLPDQTNWLDRIQDGNKAQGVAVLGG